MVLKSVAELAWQWLGRLKIVLGGLLASLAGWDLREGHANEARDRRSYKLLLWRLGVGCVLLLVLVGATYDWEQGSGGGSPVVAAIARATWIIYAIVQLAFLSAAVVAIYRHLQGDGTESPQANNARATED